MRSAAASRAPRRAPPPARPTPLSPATAARRRRPPPFPLRASARRARSRPPPPRPPSSHAKSSRWRNGRTEPSAKSGREIPQRIRVIASSFFSAWSATSGPRASQRAPTTTCSRSLIPRNAPRSLAIHGESHAISGIAGRLPSATARVTSRAISRLRPCAPRRRPGPPSSPPSPRAGASRRARLFGRAATAARRTPAPRRHLAGTRLRAPCCHHPSLLEGLLLGEGAHRVRDGDDRRVRFHPPRTPRTARRRRRRTTRRGTKPATRETARARRKIAVRVFLSSASVH